MRHIAVLSIGMAASFSSTATVSTDWKFFLALRSDTTTWVTVDAPPSVTSLIGSRFLISGLV
jgi:hypothetical protein